MRLKRTPGFLKNPGVDSGLALGGVGGGGEGDDDDSVANKRENVAVEDINANEKPFLPVQLTTRD